MYVMIYRIDITVITRIDTGLGWQYCADIQNWGWIVCGEPHGLVGEKQILRW